MLTKSPQSQLDIQKKEFAEQLKLAEQENAQAQNYIGTCYESGRGVDKKDAVLAVDWYRKAVKQNNLDAQVNLGDCYRKGEGVEQDVAQAVAWYRRAAELKHAPAQTNLGVCYKQGLGIQKDLELAVKWYTEAAVQGHADAQCNLAGCFLNGQGVGKDEGIALGWYLKAAAQGHARAKKRADALTALGVEPRYLAMPAAASTVTVSPKPVIAQPNPPDAIAATTAEFAEREQKAVLDQFKLAEQAGVVVPNYANYNGQAAAPIGNMASWQHVAAAAIISTRMAKQSSAAAPARLDFMRGKYSDIFAVHSTELVFHYWPLYLPDFDFNAAGYNSNTFVFFEAACPEDSKFFHFKKFHFMKTGRETLLEIPDINAFKKELTRIMWGDSVVMMPYVKQYKTKVISPEEMERLCAAGKGHFNQALNPAWAFKGLPPNFFHEPLLAFLDKKNNPKGKYDARSKINGKTISQLLYEDGRMDKNISVYGYDTNTLINFFNECISVNSLWPKKWIIDEFLKCQQEYWWDRVNNCNLPKREFFELANYMLNMLSTTDIFGFEYGLYFGATSLTELNLLRPLFVAIDCYRIAYSDSYYGDSHYDIRVQFPDNFEHVTEEQYQVAACCYDLRLEEYEKFLDKRLVKDLLSGTGEDLLTRKEREAIKAIADDAERTEKERLVVARRIILLEVALDKITALKINFYGTPIFLASALRKNRTVGELKCHTPTEGLKLLAYVIEGNQGIQILKLSCDKFDPEAIKTLALALAKNKGIRTLNLSDNMLNVEGLRILATMLEENTTLTKLDIHRRDLDHEGKSIKADIETKIKRNLDLRQQKAKQGDAQAQYELACRYENGDNIKRDESLALGWYKKAAAQGHQDAQQQANILKARGVEPIDESAQEIFFEQLKLAEESGAIAQNYVGVCYHNGQGVKQAAHLAVVWYRKAANQNHAQAQFNLAVSREYGQGIEKDENLALGWYEKAAAQNFEGARKRADILKARGVKPIDESEQEFFLEQLKLAKEDNAQAQYDAGFCYQNGKGVERNDGEAAAWYRKAADQNHAQAQYNLGVCEEESTYSSFLFYSRNEIALGWYEKAAAQNHEDARRRASRLRARGVEPIYESERETFQEQLKLASEGGAIAQNYVGFCYQDGKGVKRNAQQAVAWYRKAADKNHAQAQYNLGVCHENGQGVEKDENLALGWYEKAATQNYEEARRQADILKARGVELIYENEQEVFLAQLKLAGDSNAIAQNYIGFCFQNGQGVKRNIWEAAVWYRKAAEQNHAQAQFSLAVFYETGQGVVRDGNLALEWYKKAAAQDHVQAQQAEKRLGQLKQAKWQEIVLQQQARFNNLITGLQQNTLTHLDLSNEKRLDAAVPDREYFWHLGDQTFVKLLEVLQNNRSLQSVSFRNCVLSDEAVMTLIALLSSNNITQADLTDTGITKQGVKELQNGLKDRKTRLKILHESSLLPFTIADPQRAEEKTDQSSEILNAVNDGFKDVKQVLVQQNTIASMREARQAIIMDDVENHRIATIINAVAPTAALDAQKVTPVVATRTAATADTPTVTQAQLIQSQNGPVFGSPAIPGLTVASAAASPPAAAVGGGVVTGASAGAARTPKFP